MNTVKTYQGKQFTPQGKTYGLGMSYTKFK